MKRIAFYGGSFDPVHCGHLTIARRLTGIFELDEFVFVPAFHAPHKKRKKPTSAFQRFAMLALATQDDPQLSISTFELDAPDRRYTVDTVEHFQQVLGESTELFFIMGADSWSEITTWREWERLLSMTNHIVVTRPGYEPVRTHVGAVGERIVDLRSGQSPQVEGDKKIYFTDVVMKDVSATAIRRLASEGRINELIGQVPGPVLEYIKKYGIYKN
jgi:nicotinate-nucleotide adenylyltransferase